MQTFLSSGWFRVTGRIGLCLALASAVSLAEVQTDYVVATNAAATNRFAGRVGIGTNNPAYMLHLVGDMKVSGAVRVPKQGDLEMGSYTNGDAGDGIGSAEALPEGRTGNLMFNDGADWVALTNFYYDAASARLYLNSTNTGVYLDQGGLDGESGAFYRNWVNITNKVTFGGSGTTGLVNSDTNDAGRFLRADGTWQEAGDFKADGSVPMTGNVKLDGHWVSGDGGNEGIYVSSDGKIGIGTNAPATFLHVKGSIRGEQYYVYGTRRDANWTDAYNWGDHAAAGYVKRTNLFAGAGSTGVVKSTAGDTNKYLRGDGTWQDVAATVTNVPWTTGADFNDSYVGFPRVTLTTNMISISSGGGTPITMASMPKTVDNSFTTSSSTGVVNNSVHTYLFDLGKQYTGWGVVKIKGKVSSGRFGAAFTYSSHENLSSGINQSGVGNQPAVYGEAVFTSSSYKTSCIVRPFVGRYVGVCVEQGSANSQSFSIFEVIIYGITNGWQNFTGTIQ